MEKKIDLLIERLNEAVAADDNETILKISEEIDSIISKLLPDKDKLKQLKNEL